MKEEKLTWNIHYIFKTTIITTIIVEYYSVSFELMESVFWMQPFLKTIRFLQKDKSIKDKCLKGIFKYWKYLAGVSSSFEVSCTDHARGDVALVDFRLTAGFGRDQRHPRRMQRHTCFTWAQQTMHCIVGQIQYFYFATL